MPNNALLSDKFSAEHGVNVRNSLKMNVRSKTVALHPRKASRFKIDGLRF
ncbi:hypothetical protein [Rheinheimera riviphila]|nr:hypothetical protein [Rheinheimera riviphila]